MDEDLKLYIPLGVKPEAELFTGFGKKQLFQSIVGSLVMGGIAALAWLFTGNVTTTVNNGCTVWWLGRKDRPVFR